MPAASATRMPNCSFCAKAGFRADHYLRAQNGRVCCPRLLLTECRNCGKKGHTVQYCTVRAPASREFKRTPVPTAPPAAATKKPENMFAALDSDSEDEETPAAPVAPAPVKVTIIVRTPTAGITFADALKAPAPQAPAEPAKNPYRVLSMNWAAEDSDEE